MLLTVGRPEHTSEDQVRTYVQTHLTEQAKEVYSFNKIQKFELPSSQVQYSTIFGKMKEAQNGGTVTDWGVSSASLEDVFLKVAAQFVNFE